MERPELIRKLESMLDSVARERMWGSIEIEFQNGAPVRIRKSSTEKLEAENNRDSRHQR